MIAPSPKTGSTTRRILKMMSIFGSVQAVQMLCSVVRTKFVALWIGAAGIGLFGIFSSAFEMISVLVQLGIRNSGVREIAVAAKERLPLSVLAIRRWGLLLGVAGALLTAALSVPLSLFTFGDTAHWWGYALLGAAILLSTLSTTESAVFQGIGQLKRLATGLLCGTIGGLAVSIPMFRLWGEGSIVPSILAYALCGWIGLGLYRAKVAEPAVRPGWRESLISGKQVIVLGIYLTICDFMTYLVAFVFMSWLNRDSGEEAVGFFQSGFTIANKYLGVIFTALALEFYPRLSGVIRSRRGVRLTVSHETSLIMLIIIPVATLFIACDQWIVRLLYKEEFLVILPFVTWAVVGTVFRAASWCMSFSILAWGDGRTFLWTEALSSVIYLGCNCLFYKLWGITGMGVAYLLWYALYTLIIGWVYIKKYGYRINRGAVGLTVTALLAVGVAAASRTLLGWEYAGGVALAASLFSLMIFRRIFRRRRALTL